jgi:hypothetical protein
MNDHGNIPFPKFQTYIQKAIGIHSGARSAAQVVRRLVKWIFDFLRNVMIAGLILYLGIKNHNETLKNFSYGAIALLFVYLWSYLDFWLLSPFHGMQNVKIARVLNGAVQLVIIVGLSVISLVLITKLIEEIAFGYLGNGN